MTVVLLGAENEGEIRGSTSVVRVKAGISCWIPMFERGRQLENGNMLMVPAVMDVVWVGHRFCWVSRAGMNVTAPAAHRLETSAAKATPQCLRNVCYGILETIHSMESAGQVGR